MGTLIIQEGGKLVIQEGGALFLKLSTLTQIFSDDVWLAIFFLIGLYILKYVRDE